MIKQIDFQSFKFYVFSFRGKCLLWRGHTCSPFPVTLGKVITFSFLSFFHSFPLPQYCTLHFPERQTCSQILQKNLFNQGTTTLLPICLVSRFISSSISICFMFYNCCAKLLQSCQTLCDPMDCRLPGPSVHGILQARILEWLAIFFSLQLLLTMIYNIVLSNC